MFRIGYLGNLDKHDFPWKLFLDALKGLADKVGREKVRFVHCGFHSSDVKDYMQRNDIEELIIAHGLLPHADAMRLISATEIRLLLLYETEYSGSIVPAKLYNYLIMNGPILAIAPEKGAVSRIIAETNAGVVLSPNRSIEDLNQLLLKYYRDWERGELSVNFEQDEVMRYDRRSHTSQLAEILLKGT